MTRTWKPHASIYICEDGDYQCCIVFHVAMKQQIAFMFYVTPDRTDISQSKVQVTIQIAAFSQENVFTVISKRESNI